MLVTAEGGDTDAHDTVALTHGGLVGAAVEVGVAQGGAIPLVGATGGHLDGGLVGVLRVDGEVDVVVVGAFGIDNDGGVNHATLGVDLTPRGGEAAADFDNAHGVNAGQRDVDFHDAVASSAGGQGVQERTHCGHQTAVPADVAGAHEINHVGRVNVGGQLGEIEHEGGVARGVHHHGVVGVLLIVARPGVVHARSDGVNGYRVPGRCLGKDCRQTYKGQQQTR